jgi:hypothetical protein
MEGRTQEEPECPSLSLQSSQTYELTSVTYRLPILVSMCRMSPTLCNEKLSQQYIGCHKSNYTETVDYYTVIIFTSIQLFKYTTAGNTVVTLALVSINFCNPWMSLSAGHLCFLGT